MIGKISLWARTIVIAVIIVSILEMFLPNNKSKKYVKMIMSLFILYNIISPFIINKNEIKFEDSEIETISNQTMLNTIEVNQESMDRRIEELYIKEIEKDIIKKIEKKGYKVNLCKVQAKISDDENITGITKIKLKVEKTEIKKEDEQDNENNKDLEFENKLVAKIQSIKKIDTNISKKENNNNDQNKMDKSDIQNLKKFLIEEYEVNEKCLEIN